MTASGRAEEILAGAIRSGESIHVRVGDDPAVGEAWLSMGKVIGAAAEGGELRSRIRLEREPAATVGNSEAKYALAAVLAAPEEDLVVDRMDPPDWVAGLELDAKQLLSQAKRFLRDISEAGERVSRGDVPIAVERAFDPSFAPAETEQAVLECCDGSRDVGAIATECGLPVPEAILVVSRLISAGHAELRASSEASALLAELEAAQDLETLAHVLDESLDAPADPDLVSVNSVEGDSVDMASLMRELASLAREEPRR